VNKTKKVAWHKHLAKAKKYKEKQKNLKARELLLLLQHQQRGDKRRASLF